MKIRFKKDCELEVIENFDEKNETTQSVNETFIEGEVVDGDVVDDEEGYVSFQFGDGSMVFGLQKELFDVIENA